MTVKLNAESKYGFSGQYIARITGRAAKFQFNREFVGNKYGKRNECSSYETDEIGLYEECDVTKSGKTKSYALVMPWKDDVRKLYSDTEDALKIAKRLDDGETLDQIIVLELEPMTETKYGSQCTVCQRSENLDPGPHCPDHPNAPLSTISVDVPKLKEDGTVAHRLVYKIRSPGEAKKAEASGNIESAVEAIIAALAALPEKQAKQALNGQREDNCMQLHNRAGSI
jgi:hypothetical protein